MGKTQGVGALRIRTRKNHYAFHQWLTVCCVILFQLHDNPVIFTVVQGHPDRQGQRQMWTQGLQALKSGFFLLRLPRRIGKGRLLAFSELLLLLAWCLVELVQLFEDELPLLGDFLPGPPHTHIISTIHCSSLATCWNVGGEGNKNVSHSLIHSLFIHDGN